MWPITYHWINPEKAACIVRNRVIIPIGGVHRGVMHALRYARTLSDDLTAVYVAIDPEETQEIEGKVGNLGGRYPPAYH